VHLLLFLLALQAEQSPAPAHSRDRNQSESESVRSTQFEIGPILQYWFPRFKGDFRFDGSSKSGTRIDLVHDLNLPNEGGIPMYGGGAIGAWARVSPSDHGELLFEAEYWAHARAGSQTLNLPMNLGDETFPKGTFADSRFTTTCLTLDAMGAYSSGPLYGGICLSIQARSARLRMDSAAVHAKETIDDVYWGGGLFFEFRPIPYTMGGLSIKGFTSFGDATETSTGDFRFYAGFRWNALSLEGGYRIDRYVLDLSEKGLGTTMQGAYVALNAIIRF